MTRRSLLGLLVMGASALAGSVVGVPAILSGLSPIFQPRRRQAWRPVIRVNDLPIGKVQEGEVQLDDKVWPRPFSRQAVFIWRQSESEVVVFSRRCTDLGCPLDYDPGSTCFFCPCHGGIFSQDGGRLAGPPKGPMHRYAHRIDDGVLEIDLSSLPPGA